MWVLCSDQAGQNSEGKYVCCCSVVTPLNRLTLRPEKNLSLYPGWFASKELLNKWGAFEGMSVLDIAG